MSLTLAKTVLLSRRIRQNSSKGVTGRSLLSGDGRGAAAIRKIGKLTKLTTETKQGGWLSFLWDKGSSLVGWIGKKAWNFISFSATTVFSWVFNAVEKLKAFDWNATDKQLQAMVANSNIALAGIWGSFLGQGIGWVAGIAVGYGVSYLLPVIGGAGLAKLIASKTSIEAIEELSGSLFGAVSATAGIMGTNLAINAYMGYRNMLKRAPRPLLEAVYGKDGADWIQKFWGQDGGINLSFNAQVESALNSINDKALKIFLENLLEESWDSFIEAGFVVAAEIDNAYSQSRQGAAAVLGTPKTVEITLDRTAESSQKEKIQIVNLPQKLAQQEIQRTINTARLLNNRDVGLIMGTPIEEYTKAKPQSLRIVIDLFSIKKPPYFRRTENLTRATITIPDANLGAIDWNRIKLACGGANGYQWGRFRAVASLSTGRRLVLHAGSEQEAESRVMAFLELSSAKLLTLNITEEKRLGERLTKPKLQKESTRVYPAFFTVINRQDLLDPTSGRATARGKNYRDNRARVPLWLDKEPANSQSLIRSILRFGV